MINEMSDEAFVFGVYTNYQLNLDPGRTKSMFQAKWRSQEKVRLDLGLRIAVNEYDYVCLANTDNSEAGFLVNIVSLSDLEYQLKNVEERDNSYWIKFSSAPVVNGRNPTGRDFKIRETFIPRSQEGGTTDNPNGDRFETALPVPASSGALPTFIDFAEERLELGIDYGAVGGPSFNTEIVLNSIGSSSRNATSVFPTGRWQLGDRVIADSDDGLKEVSYLKKFHAERLGSYQGFRYKDWTDYQAYHQIIGVGDGVKTAFTLSKAYKVGNAVTRRPILKPVIGTVVLYANGESTAAASEPGGVGWTVNHSTGVISNPEPIEPGVVLSASFEFDVPVWFESDEIGFDLQGFSDDGGAIYRLESVFVVEGKIPPGGETIAPVGLHVNEETSFQRPPKYTKITTELDLGIIYDTIERQSFTTLRTELKSGYQLRNALREKSKLLVDLGSRVYDRDELDTLLAYFWN